jgi:hypothetical protein
VSNIWHSATAFRIMTLSIRLIMRLLASMTLGINYTQHNTISHYGEWRYAECQTLFIVRLSVVMLNVELYHCRKIMPSNVNGFFTWSSRVCTPVQLTCSGWTPGYGIGSSRGSGSGYPKQTPKLRVEMRRNKQRRSMLKLQSKVSGKESLMKEKEKYNWPSHTS